MEVKETKYKEYLLPALCLMIGILVGILSKNGCRNKADDMMIGARKDR